MKIKILLIITTILILTGCSTNKLNCTKQIGSTTIKITAKYNKEGSINNLEYKQKNIYDILDAYIDIHYYDLKEQYTSLDNIEGIIYEVKENKNDITINLNIDYNKLPNIENRLIPIEKNTNIENSKQKLINEGYICK